MTSKWRRRASSLEEVCRKMWHDNTDDSPYESLRDENRRLQKQYNLSPTRVFVLDLIDDWVNMTDDENKQEEYRQFKKELLDSLGDDYRLKGAL